LVELAEPTQVVTIKAIEPQELEARIVEVTWKPSPLVVLRKQVSGMSPNDTPEVSTVQQYVSKQNKHLRRRADGRPVGVKSQDILDRLFSRDSSRVSIVRDLARNG
jgi:hypothetical protein